MMEAFHLEDSLLGVDNSVGRNRAVKRDPAANLHGGQVKIGNWAVASAFWETYIAGAYTKGFSRLYVNRGLGTSYYLPVRYRCTAEIVLTTIKSKA